MGNYSNNFEMLPYIKNTLGYWNFVWFACSICVFDSFLRDLCSPTPSPHASAIICKYKTVYDCVCHNVVKG